jgi:putative DNA primase/helicase
LACGQDSEIFVVDVDDPTEWQSLVDKNGELPKTVESQTGGGGNHFFFKYPDNGQKVSTGTGVPVRGVDIRGDGGQVVLPPAPHESGMEYAWINSPEDTQIAECPEWLLDLIKEATAEQEWAGLQDVWYDRQNDHLHHWSRVLVHAGNTDAQIKDIFKRKFEGGGIPNLDPREPWTLTKVLQPVDSGISAARKQLSTPLSGSAGGDGMGGGGKILQFGTPKGLTDADNALRLRHHFGHQLRYATGLGWSTWDEHRWRLDRERLWVMRYAEQTTKKIQAESGTLTGADATKVQNWARLSRNMPRLNAMITLSQGLEGVMQEVEDFDASHTDYMLNFLNGTLDIRTGTLRAQRREDLISKLVPYAWDAGADCPVWLETLDYAFGDDPEMISFIQRALGLSLTGEIPEHLFICWGSDGRNGKSTILENFYEILDADYGASFSPDAMMAQGNDNFSLSTLAQMRGVRYATTSESGENDALKVSLVKMITGGDTITVKFMRQDSFSYRPKFKVWIRTNHKPRVSETTDPIWRRIVLIPFLHQIPEDKIRTRQEVDADILGEAAGVLAWAVRGAQDYLENGLRMPDAVREAVDNYRSENDPIGMFIREQCVLGKDYETTRTGFRSALEQWGKGIVGWRKAPSTQKIATYLETKHGVYVNPGGGNIHTYAGIALKNEVESGTMENMLS